MSRKKPRFKRHSHSGLPTFWAAPTGLATGIRSIVRIDPPKPIEPKVSMIIDVTRAFKDRLTKQLRHDGITQQHFFRRCAEAYLRECETMELEARGKR